MSARSTKAWPEALDAYEALWLRIYRAMTPRDREITFDAMCRLRDGQPLEQNLIELGIDFGQSPNEARESAREAMSGDACDLHKALD